MVARPDAMQSYHQAHTSLPTTRYREVNFAETPYFETISFKLFRGKATLKTQLFNYIAENGSSIAKVLTHQGIDFKVLTWPGLDITAVYLDAIWARNMVVMIDVFYGDGVDRDSEDKEYKRTIKRAAKFGLGVAASQAVKKLIDEFFLHGGVPLSLTSNFRSLFASGRIEATSATQRLNAALGGASNYALKQTAEQAMASAISVPGIALRALSDATGAPRRLNAALGGASNYALKQTVERAMVSAISVPGIALRALSDATGAPRRLNAALGGASNYALKQTVEQAMASAISVPGIALRALSDATSAPRRVKVLGDLVPKAPRPLSELRVQ